MLARLEAGERLRSCVEYSSRSELSDAESEDSGDTMTLHDEPRVLGIADITRIYIGIQ